MNEKNNEFEINIESILNSNKKHEKIEIIVELLENKFKNTFIDVELYDDEKNLILIENDVDQFYIDEIFDDLNIEFEFVLIDDELQQYIIKIDDDEFVEKNIIESFDDLLKFYKEKILYDELFDDDENIEYIKNNYIGMNKYNDYIMKKCYLYDNFLKFDLNDNDDDIILLDKFKKIVDDEFIDDIEIYIDIYTLIDDDVELYKNYDIELNNRFNIIVDHDNRTIENINNVYNFICTIINKYLFIDNNTKILFDEIVDLYNILKFDSKIIKYDESLFEINIDPIEFYDYYDNTYKFYNELKDNFIYYYDNYQLNVFENIEYVLNIDVVEYDYIFNNLFDVEFVVEFIDNYVNINYDEINYDNYLTLNEFFYNVFIQHHLNEIDITIYNNIRNIRKLKKYDPIENNYKYYTIT